MIFSQLNRSEFEGMDEELRVLYEGYRAGLYVRIEIRDMPCEFVTNFDPTSPVILEGMTSSETVVGMLQVSLSFKIYPRGVNFPVSLIQLRQKF